MKPFKITCRACGWFAHTRKSEAGTFRCPKCGGADLAVVRIA